MTLRLHLIKGGTASIMAEAIGNLADSQGALDAGPMDPLPLFIALEANIGAGKSTQIARLQKLFEGNERIVVLPEPVDEWVEKGFLTAMYDNPDNPWLLDSDEEDPGD